MVSLHAQDSGYYVLTDDREDTYTPIIQKETVLACVTRNPETASFAGWIRSVPEMARRLNSRQTACSVFAPVGRIDVMDRDVARWCLRAHLCELVLTPDMLSEGNVRVESMTSACPIQATKGCGGVMLNGRAEILYYERVGQSFVYYIDDLLNGGSGF